MTLAERIAEALENGGFVYQGKDDDGRDTWHYVRSSRNGVPLSDDQDRPAYVLKTCGPFVMRCSCPDSQRALAEGDGRQCKHSQALEWWIGEEREATPVRVGDAAFVLDAEEDWNGRAGR